MSAVALKITIDSLPGSRIAVKLNIPAERCKSSYEEALSRLSRSVKLPGFRQGKVPKTVLLQQIGSSRIQATALERLIDSAWKEALKQESIEPLCEPELKNGFESLLENYDPAKDLDLVLETDVAPIPKLKATTGLTAQIETITFDPDKIDELIEESRKQLATLIPIEDRSAKMGDIAVVSFTGNYEDGSLIDGGSSDSMDIELETGRMIPGFVEGIIGMDVDNEKTIKCTFPNDYPEESARGKKAQFIIKLKELKTRELPKLDDEFAKQASEKSSMLELRKELEERLKEDVKRRNLKNKNEALLKALVSQLEVDLPKSLVDQEVAALVEETAHKFAQQGMDVKSMFTPELVKSLMESSRDEAKENLLKKLALSALAKSEEIKVPDEELEEKLKEVKKELAREKNIDQDRLQKAVFNDLLEEKLFDWLHKNNNFEEKEDAGDTNKKANESAPKDKKVIAKKKKA